jgi:hypothetical protein
MAKENVWDVSSHPWSKWPRSRLGLIRIMALRSVPRCRLDHRDARGSSAASILDAAGAEW